MFTYSSYIDALIKIDNGMVVKWGNSDHFSPVTELRFSFMQSIPTYMDSLGLIGFAQPDETLQSAIRSMLESVSYVCGLRFTETSDASDIELRFGTYTSSLAFSSDTLGMAYYPDPYNEIGGDVLLKSTGYDTGGFSIGSYGYGVLMHESGHAVGLKHPFDGYYTLDTAEQVNTMMSYNWQYDASYPTAPLTYDVMALRYLYGASLSEKKEIAALYIAFFDRAPDSAGFEYWLNRMDPQNKGAILDEVAGLFATHPVFDTLYGSLENLAFVQSVYLNILGSEGDTGGISGWTQMLDGGMSRSDMVSAFVQSALELDLTMQPSYLNTQEYQEALVRQNTLSNKADVALAFTALGIYSDIQDFTAMQSDPAYIASEKIISHVTDDPSTEIAAIDFLRTVGISSDAIYQINNSMLFA